MRFPLVKLQFKTDPDKSLLPLPGCLFPTSETAPYGNNNEQPCFLTKGPKCVILGERKNKHEQKKRENNGLWILF